VCRAPCLPTCKKMFNDVLADASIFLEGSVQFLKCPVFEVLIFKLSNISNLIMSSINVTNENIAGILHAQRLHDITQYYFHLIKSFHIECSPNDFALS
jgi:hypothetical protein